MQNKSQIWILLFTISIMIFHTACGYEKTSSCLQISDLVVIPGKKKGVIKADWKKLQGADNYTFQIFINDTLVIKEGIVEKSKVKITDLPSRQKMYLRVRGNGEEKKHGPWSISSELTVQ